MVNSDKESGIRKQVSGIREQEAGLPSSVSGNPSSGHPFPVSDFPYFASFQLSAIGYQLQTDSIRLCVQRLSPRLRWM
jgi:hypothetical protein